MSEDKTHDEIILKLRDVRRAKGMSLHTLANKVGIDYQRVGRIERGETQMTVDMLNKISKVLHVPITDLLSEQNLNKIEEKVAQQANSKSVNLIPYIYEKVEQFCSKNKIIVDPKVMVHIATLMFNAVAEIRTNRQDDEDVVEVLFAAFDAIFERLFVSKDN